MGTVKSMAEARALAEARKVFEASFPAGAHVWRRRLRYEWMTGFKRGIFIELLPTLELRVTDLKTGELIVQGPAK